MICIKIYENKGVEFVNSLVKFCKISYKVRKYKNYILQMNTPK